MDQHAIIGGEVNGADVLFQHGEGDIACLLHEPEEEIILDTFISI